MRRLRDRPTADLVVMFLTGLVGIVLVTAMIGFIILESLGERSDLGVLATRIAAITNTLIGAIVGYLAGRNTDSSGPKGGSGDG